MRPVRAQHVPSLADAVRANKDYQCHCQFHSIYLPSSSALWSARFSMSAFTGYRIRWYDNIPLLSYIALRGKCRSCKTRISPQYPAVELINGLLTLFLFTKFGPTVSFLVLFLFCSALVVITFIDLEYQIIPDVISLPGIGVGFAASFILPWLSWQSSLIGILAGGGSLLLVAYGYQLLTKKEGMGGGDIKLLAMMGAFLGRYRSLFFPLHWSARSSASPSCLYKKGTRNWPSPLVRSLPLAQFFISSSARR